MKDMDKNNNVIQEGIPKDPRMLVGKYFRSRDSKIRYVRVKSFHKFVPKTVIKFVSIGTEKDMIISDADGEMHLISFLGYFSHEVGEEEVMEFIDNSVYNMKRHIKDVW